jgi:chromosome segregation ATPase
MCDSISDVQKLEEKLEDTNREMRDRSHQLAAIVQAHTSELAVMKSIADDIGDLKTAFYGDLKSGTETGMRGAVQRLYQEQRDTELRRDSDRRREDEQFAELRKQNQEHTDEIKKLNTRNDRRGGAFGLVREIGNTITVVAVAGGLVVGIVQLILRAGH